MGLFKSRRPRPSVPGLAPANEIPVAQIDLSIRYDVYCSLHGVGGGEERLYENVRFIGVRTLAYVSHFLEIETPEGARVFLPAYGVHLLCEHGTLPVFKVLKRWGDSSDC